MIMNFAVLHVSRKLVRRSKQTDQNVKVDGSQTVHTDDWCVFVRLFWDILLLLAWLLMHALSMSSLQNNWKTDRIGSPSVVCIWFYAQFSTKRDHAIIIMAWLLVTDGALKYCKSFSGSTSVSFSAMRVELCADNTTPPPTETQTETTESPTIANSPCGYTCHEVNETPCHFLARKNWAPSWSWKLRFPLSERKLKEWWTSSCKLMHGGKNQIAQSQKATRERLELKCMRILIAYQKSFACVERLFHIILQKFKCNSIYTGAA